MRYNNGMGVRSYPTEDLLQQIRLYGLPTPILEYRFHSVRKWRFDIAWADPKLAVEVEGGIWVRGRHSRGSGFEKDCEKYAEAILLGWTVLRVTPGMISKGMALAYIEGLLRTDEPIRVASPNLRNRRLAQ